MYSYLDYINVFTEGLADCHHRYASFDYCYSYFKTHVGLASDALNMSTSCFILWAYLASWGMLRGSSQLLQKNPHYLESLIVAIDKNRDLFNEQYDFPNWGEQSNRTVILNCYNEFREVLGEINPTCTLLTKIMLGVYGCVPALDTYFKLAFDIHASHLNDLVMLKIFQFKDENQAELKSMIWNKKPFVRNYDTNKPMENLTYTSAKMVDMYGFVRGIILSYQSKNIDRKMTVKQILDMFEGGILQK